MDSKRSNHGTRNWPARAAIGRRVKSLVCAFSHFRLASLDLVFPRSCVACQSELVAKGPDDDAVLLCEECVEQLALFEGSMCVRCGATGPANMNARHDRCPKCHDLPLWFDRTLALGDYSGLMRRWLLRAKRGEGDALTLAIAQLIWKRCHERLAAIEPDVVVPVPMHWQRRWKHGTNSAALMAEILAQRLRVPLAAGLLRRTRNTPPQFTLPPSGRRANVRRAFAVRAGYHLSKARVLLVDDILTTGATCSEAAHTLKRGGAEYVAVVVAGRTMRH